MRLIYTLALLSFQDAFQGAAAAKHVRMLSEASDVAPDEYEIAEYQIFAGVSIILVIVVFFALSALFNIDVGSDTLLYTKVLASLSPRTRLCWHHLFTTALPASSPIKRVRTFDGLEF